MNDDSAAMPPNNEPDAASPGGGSLPRLQLKLHLNRQSAETVSEPPPQTKSNAASLAAMIDESISEPQPETGNAAFAKEMECVNCGLLADVDMDVESCTCPDCGGTMYPSAAIDSEKTISYLDASSSVDGEIEEEGDGESDSAQRFRSIKVAQPVSVGMFTATGSSAINPSSSSQQIKGVDFLSTGSGSSLSLSESQKNCNAKMSELEMMKKNLEEEKAELQLQREQLEAAIGDFNEKRQMFEQIRLDWELQRQNAAAAPVTPTEEVINMAETLLAQDPLNVAINSRKEKMLTIAMAIMGVLLLLQTIGLVLLAIKR